MSVPTINLSFPLTTERVQELVFSMVLERLQNRLDCGETVQKDGILADVYLKSIFRFSTRIKEEVTTFIFDMRVHPHVRLREYLEYLLRTGPFGELSQELYGLLYELVCQGRYETAFMRMQEIADDEEVPHNEGFDIRNHYMWSDVEFEEVPSSEEIVDMLNGAAAGSGLTFFTLD